MLRQEGLIGPPITATDNIADSVESDCGTDSSFSTGSEILIGLKL